MFIDEVMTVKTTAGDFRIIETHDENFPGVKIYFKGQLMCIAEYIEEDGIARTIAYTEDKDEPVNITNYNKE